MSRKSSFCDPVFTFDEFMEGIDLEAYLKNIFFRDKDYTLR